MEKAYWPLRLALEKPPAGGAREPMQLCAHPVSLPHERAVHKFFRAYKAVSRRSEESWIRRHRDLALTGQHVPNIIICTSILWRSKKLNSARADARNPDGAEIYFCYWRSCFLTW